MDLDTRVALRVSDLFNAQAAEATYQRLVDFLNQQALETQRLRAHVRELEAQQSAQEALAAAALDEKLARVDSRLLKLEQHGQLQTERNGQVQERVKRLEKAAIEAAREGKEIRTEVGKLEQTTTKMIFQVARYVSLWFFACDGTPISLSCVKADEMLCYTGCVVAFQVRTEAASFELVNSLQMDQQLLHDRISTIDRRLDTKMEKSESSRMDALVTKINAFTPKSDQLFEKLVALSKNQAHILETLENSKERWTIHTQDCSRLKFQLKTTMSSVESLQLCLNDSVAQQLSNYGTRIQQLDETVADLATKASTNEAAQRTLSTKFHAFVAGFTEQLKKQSEKCQALVNERARSAEMSKKFAAHQRELDEKAHWDDLQCVAEETERLVIQCSKLEKHVQLSSRFMTWFATRGEAYEHNLEVVETQLERIAFNSRPEAREPFGEQLVKAAARLVRRTFSVSLGHSSDWNTMIPPLHPYFIRFIRQLTLSSVAAAEDRAMNANSYGTVDFAQEQDAFLGSTVTPMRASGTSKAATWGKFAVAAALGVVGVSYCVSVQTSLQAQQATIALMQQQLESMHAVVVQSAAAQAHASISNSAHFASSSSARFPPKFHVEHVTPLKTQDNRGTCWDFATIGPLEQSYRSQGIHSGWLAPNEYVAFSEQAYGAEVLRLCSGPPGSPQQVACLIPGNMIWENSTEGGESAELYYLMNGLKDSVFPDSLCPYIPDDGNDTVCAGLTPQKRETNPLKLTLRKMDTLYEEASVKKALVSDKRAMAFTTSMPYITYYYPCVGEFVNDPRCNPASSECTLCPADMPQTTCCIPVHGKENYNMDGEFITSAGMAVEGGHVMTLVGYNDLYRTKQGYTGGFILKNSWWDGVHPKLGPAHARGSHTIKYWMQEVSDWEERSMCPNSHNPENWYQCGDFGEVIQRNADSGVRVPLPLTKSTGVFKEAFESCLSEETELYAKTNLQPLHLRCTDSAYCLEDANVTYFARNSTDYGDRMQIMCFYEYNTFSKNASELCLPPLLVQQIAYVFSPVEDEVLVNDPDVCGHYLYPYEVLQQYVSKFGNFYVNNFDVQWHPQSYAANAKHYPELNYTEVVASTRKQNEYAFVGPFPFARIVAKDDLPKAEGQQ